MVYLMLAIISSSLVSIVMRVGERKAKNNISMLSVNYFICMIVSLIYTFTGKTFQIENGFNFAICLGGINGFFYIAGLVLFQNSVKNNGVVLSSIFMKLGIMMPLIISIVLFQEIPTKIQVIGFVLAILAIVMINIKEKKTTAIVERNSKSFKIGLILVLIGCGMADGMSKVYQELGTENFEELFLALTFITAFILSVILVKIKQQRFTKNEILYGIMLGIPNYFSARFLLKSLGQIPAVVAYPTFSIGTIAVITFTGMFIFKEKITKIQMVAIGIIAIAVIMLN